MNRAWPILLLAAATTLEAADWAQWRGPKRDGHSSERLLDKIPDDITPTWKISIGPGFSAPVVAGDKVIFIGGTGDQEAAHCLSAKNGKELWKVPFAELFSDEWGKGTRATPIIDGGKVYAQSCNGEFRCLELESGQVLWGMSFEKDFGVPFLGSKAREGTASRRGNSGSPVIDGELVFVPVGGTNGAAVVAFNKETGKVAWKSGDDEAAYSSLMVADLAGVRQVVAFTAEALCGFRRDSGQLLWRFLIATQAKRNVCTPVILGDNVIVNTFTYGMACYTISKKDDGFAVTESWRNKNTKINLATPVLVGGFLYSHGPSRNFVCVDASSGQVKWTQPGFGEQVSSTIAVGDKLVVLADSGQMIVIKPNPERYEEVARAQVCGKSWTQPAFSGGQLYVRDNRELISLPIGEASR